MVSPMQDFVVLAYDIVTVLIFIYMIVVGARRGFARTLACFIGYVAALFGAAALSEPAARWIFEALLRPSIVSGISEKLSQVQAELLPESLLSFAQSIPEGVLGMLGLDPEKLVETLHDLIGSSGAGAAGAIADSVIAPLVVNLLKAVLFLLLFSVAMFFVRRLAGVFGEINRLPLIGPANQIMGGLVGAAQAALTMYVIVLVLGLVLSLTAGSLEIHRDGQAPLVLCSEAVFARTLFFKAFVNWNPLDLLLFAQDAGWLKPAREPSNNALAVSGMLLLR
ncbi:MAG: CvpA family protein [Provencibacterium sp.]|jgi:uncharacterized membrane protein required for colicin V production|nr:CvpA family protein [Provencibacterium sp.]